MKIVGVGQCSWDYLAVVDSFPCRDSKKEVLSWNEQGGGPTATALVALSRLGAGCSFHGTVGDDPEAGKIRQSLIYEGIDVCGLLPRAGSESQKAFIVIERESGKRTIFWKRPSGADLETGEMEENFLEGLDLLMLDGLMGKVSLHAAKIANEMKVPVMLDAGSLREGMLDLAQRCDYVVTSEKFARQLGYDGDNGKFAALLEGLGLLKTTVTLGEKGSITFMDGRIITVPAYQVEAADTTGAGDVFHGGYAYGILNGWDIETVLRFASAMAAIKCRSIGGRAGIPDLKTVLEFLRERGESVSIK